MKRSLLITGVIGALVLGACASLSNANISPKWQKQAPALFVNAGNVLIPKQPQKIPESVNQQWKITNPFGLRDEVLNYILTAIPESHQKAQVFAIKMAYYDQLAMLADESQVNKIINKSDAYCVCLGYQLDDLNSVFFTKGYGKILRNNKLSHDLWEQVSDRLNHHIISADFGDASDKKYNLQQACEYLAEHAQ